MANDPRIATPLAQKHMREKNNGKTICTIPYARRPNFKARGAKISTAEQMPPNELRNVDFPLDYQAFSKKRLQTSLKIVVEMTLSES